MSQDLFSEDDVGAVFADIEDNIDDPGFDTPVEFSGVSASGNSSSSPGSQQLPPPPPPPPPPSPSSCSTAQGFMCPTCSKVLMTKRGFIGHNKRFHNDSTPTRTSASASTPGPVSTPSAPSQAQLFKCPDCQSVLSTKSGYIRHRASHKLKQISQKIPSPSDFPLGPSIDKIIDEMLAEPFSGDIASCPKIIFLHTFCSAKGSKERSDFEVALADAIFPLVFKKQTKLLPSNQYEESQKNLNILLNQDDLLLSVKLHQVCKEEMDDSLINRLVFRMASKFLKDVHCWMWQEMRNAREEVVQDCAIVFRSMDEGEERAFLHSIGGMLRGYFKRGVKGGSLQSMKQSDCIKETFVDSQLSIRNSSFLNKVNWFSGNESSIVLSEHASSFFKAVENEILPAVGSYETQKVIEEILDRPDLLEHWYHLTKSFFSEDLSLLFLRDLVSSFLKLSAAQEQRRNNRLQEKETQATSTALRTHLKRNYVAKGTDDCSEDVE